MIGICSWVITVPIWTMWILYIVVPAVYDRPFSTERYLERLTMEGWLFVGASGLWLTVYVILSRRYGIPISAGV